MRGYSFDEKNRDVSRNGKKKEGTGQRQYKNPFRNDVGTGPSSNHDPSQSRTSKSRATGKTNTKSNNNDKKLESLQQQTELYAELARELEEKLAKRDAEVEALRQSNRALHKERNQHTTKIANLETQCVARSAKVAQLSDMISSRRSDKVQEKLMEKSLELADLVEETERLRIQKTELQKEKTKNGKLLLEMSDIIRMLNQIDIKYDKAETEFVEMNRVRYYDDSLTPFAGAPQDAPLENVRRKIQTIDRVLKDGEPLRQEYAVQKERIESLMEENADLNDQIASLQAKLCDAQEQEQQQRQQQKNGEQHMSEYTSGKATCDEEASKEVSYEEFVVDTKLSSMTDDATDDATEDSRMLDSYRDSRFSRVNQALSTVNEANSSEEKGIRDTGLDDSRSDHDDFSDASSFSSLEEPPSLDGEEPEKEEPNTTSRPPITAAPPRNRIDPEEYDNLKENFDKALDVIERLKNDLKQRRRTIRRPSMYTTNNAACNNQEIENAKKETARIELELEKVTAQYTALQAEFTALNDRHEELLATSTAKHAELEANYNEKIASMNETSKVAFDDVSNMNNILRQQYDDLEKEYTLKIETLQQKLKESRNAGKERNDGSGNQMKLLEDRINKARVECDAMESIHRDRISELAKDHVKALEDIQEKYDDLKYEYDTFLEIHLKVEEDALEAKMHYKDSLLKIRAMEAESRDSKEAAEKNEREHRQAVEKITTEHNMELEKREVMIVEWKGKFHALKQEYLSAIKVHEEAKEKLLRDLEETKANHQVTVAKLGELRQSDAAKYQNLRREFDAALVERGKNEQNTIHKYEQLRKAYESKIGSCQKKIDELDKVLAVTKLDSQQQTKRKIDQIQSQSKERTDQLQVQLDETVERLEIETKINRKLVQEQKDSRAELERLETSNVELRELVTRFEQELKDSSNQLQSRLEETTGRLEFEVELNQRLKQEQVHSDEKMNQLLKTKQELEERAARQDRELIESRDVKENVKDTFHELAASYQASLLKIESLIQQRESISILKNRGNSSGDDGEDSVVEGGGTVLDRIKNFEKKSETKASKAKDQRKLMSQSNVDSLFKRDFDMILQKIGYDENKECDSEVSFLTSTTESLNARQERKAIVETINERVEEYVEKMNNKIITQETEGQQAENKEETERDNSDIFEIAQIFDVLHHFVQFREVKSCFFRLPRFHTIHQDDKNTEKLGIDTSNWNDIIVSDLLLHKKRFKRVQNSLLRRTIVSGLDEMYPSRLPDVYSSCCSFSRYSISPSDLGFSTTNSVSVVEVDEKSAAPSELGFSMTDTKSVMGSAEKSVPPYNLGFSIADALSGMEADKQSVSPCDVGLSPADTLSAMEADQKSVLPCNLGFSIADRASLIQEDGKTVTSSELGFSTTKSQSVKGDQKSASPSALGFSTTDTQTVVEAAETTVSYNEASVGGNQSNDTVRHARLEAERLRDENFANQVYISTEEIKTKTREKEVRLLDLKYKNLKEEFQQLQASEIPTPPTDIAFPHNNDQGDGASCEPSIAMSSVTHPMFPALNRVDSLQKQVLAAELKVQCSKRDLQGQKSWVDKARKEQQKIDHNVKTVLGHLQDLKEQEETNCDQTVVDDNTTFSSRFEKDINDGRGLLWDIMTTSVKEEEEEPRPAPICELHERPHVVDHDPIQGNGCEPKVSFDVSHLTQSMCDQDTDDTTTVDDSIPASRVSLEHRDDKNMHRSSDSNSSTATEDAEPPHNAQVVRSPQDHSRSNHSTESINGIRLELQQAKEAAEIARRKQVEREEALREVIYQYKELEREHQALAAGEQQRQRQPQQPQQQQRPPSKTQGEGNDAIDATSIAAELKQAQANVNAMKGELEKACERHCEEKDNLMHVMDQYKMLQNDFYKILSEKQELEKVVYHRPGMPTPTTASLASSHGQGFSGSISHSQPMASSVGAGPTTVESEGAQAPTTTNAPPAHPQRQQHPAGKSPNPRILVRRGGGLLGRRVMKTVGPKRVGPPPSTIPARQKLVPPPDLHRVSFARPNPGRPSNNNNNTNNNNNNNNNTNVNNNTNAKRTGVPLKPSIRKQQANVANHHKMIVTGEMHQHQQQIHQQQMHHQQLQHQKQMQHQQMHQLQQAPKMHSLIQMHQQPQPQPRHPSKPVQSQKRRVSSSTVASVSTATSTTTPIRPTELSATTPTTPSTTASGQSQSPSRPQSQTSPTVPTAPKKKLGLFRGFGFGGIGGKSKKEKRSVPASC